MSLPVSRSSSSSSEDSDHGASQRTHFTTQARDRGRGTSSTQYTLPPMAAPSPDLRTSRPLDVHNILNPTPSHDRAYEESRQENMSSFGSPRSRPIANVHNTSRSLPHSPIDNNGGPESSSFRVGAVSRHLAHPESSVGRMNRPTSLGLVTSQQYTPGVLSSRRFSEYAGEPSSSSQTPQSSVPPATPGYPFPATPTSYNQPPPPSSSYSSQQPVSTSVSPTNSFSSYAPPGQTSLPPGGTPTAAYSSHSYGGPAHSLGSPYSLASQTQHNHFPMMALATAHGSIPVSVDTTAASKSADEKRKRNAGASARFRQRRKEREREMTQRITDLEQRLKKAEEERDYYRELCMRASQSGNPPILSPSHASSSQQQQQQQPHHSQSALHYSSHPSQQHQQPARPLHASSQGIPVDSSMYGQQQQPHGSHGPSVGYSREQGGSYGGIPRDTSTPLSGPHYQPPATTNNYSRQPPRLESAATPRPSGSLQGRSLDHYEADHERHHANPHAGHQQQN